MGKDTILRIRCSRETFIEFKTFAAKFKDYESALKELLKHYNPPPNIKSRILH